MPDQFKILKKDKQTRARTGILTTPHGKILTPAYTIVATHAKVKCLKPQDIADAGTQVVISNTYHLWEKALANLAYRQAGKKEKNLVHKLLGRKMPIMTDSGGFQVFSLGFGIENKVGKILNEKTEKIKQIKRKNIKITEKGVFFSIDGPSTKLGASKKRFLGPELSIQLQESIGADIIFAFDECTSPLDNFTYNKKALVRTHRWAKKCLACRTRKDQLLFGIVQGGRFATLRKQSAKFIGALPFDGFGIGGSFGKDEMVKTLKIVIPHLPEEKPRHLLGIGKIENVFDAVENGVDLFDCVIPTREARHGRIYHQTGFYDIRKTIYTKNNHSLGSNCKCPACKKGITRAKLHKLFKSASLSLGQRYATIHNIWFFNNLMEKIRTSIDKGSFSKFKNEFLVQI